MRKLSTILLVAMAAQSFACEIVTGNLKIDQTGQLVKLYLDRIPKNTCFKTDSATLTITLLCKSGTQESRTIQPKDTLLFEIGADVTIGASVQWYNRGKYKGRTDILSQCLYYQGSGSCFKYIETGVPQISTELPPPVQGYVIDFENDLLKIVTLWPGEIRVFNAMGQPVGFHEFLGSESVNLIDLVNNSPGLFYVNILIFRPTGLISETLQIWI